MRSEMIEVVIDSIRVSLMSQQRIVILRERDAERYLPIWIGVYEAESITIALQSVEVARPLTHDLMRNIFAQLEARILRVEVVGLREDTFYGNIVAEASGTSPSTTRATSRRNSAWTTSTSRSWPTARACRCSRRTRRWPSVASATAQGVTVIACENTMKTTKVERRQILPGVKFYGAGVVHLMNRQKEGWGYVRP